MTIAARRWSWKFSPVLLVIAGVVGSLVGCAPPEKRLERAIVAAAQRNQTYSPEHDKVLRDLAHLYVVGLKLNTNDLEKIRLANEAVARGCRDPFVRYVAFRGRLQLSDRVDEAVAHEGFALAEEMQKNSYPSFLRAYAALRAYEAWKLNFRSGDEPAAGKLLADWAWQFSFEAVQDPSVPEWVARALGWLLERQWQENKKSRDYVAATLDAAFEKRFGDCASIRLFRGERATKRAWAARGGGYGDTVTREGWEIFRRELRTAKEELEQAWRLDTGDADIPEAMITVCMGLTLPQEEMETWFQRGLATGQDGSSLCETKLLFLSPRWHVGFDDQLRFARECLDHPEYGWRAPLFLWQTHHEHFKYENMPLGYFAEPEVWQDIKRSLSTGLTSHPELVKYRMRYAYHAWLAQDWPVLKQQLDLLDPSRIDFSEIGGLTVYEQMVADAKSVR